MTKEFWKLLQKGIKVKSQLFMLLINKCHLSKRINFHKIRTVLDSQDKDWPSVWANPPCSAHTVVAVEALSVTLFINLHIFEDTIQLYFKRSGHILLAMAQSLQRPAENIKLWKRAWRMPSLEKDPETCVSCSYKRKSLSPLALQSRAQLHLFPSQRDFQILKSRRH